MGAVVIVLLVPWLLIAAVITGSRLYYRLGGGRSLARHERPETTRHMFCVEAPSGQLMRTAVDCMDRPRVLVVATERDRHQGVSRVSSLYRGQLLTLWLLPAGGVTLVEVECTSGAPSALFGERDVQQFAEGVVARLAAQTAVLEQVPAQPRSRPR